MQALLDMKIQMAHQSLQSGRMDHAETLIRQVLAHDPDNTNAVSALAVLYTRQQKYESAIEILDQATKKNPDDANTLVRLATVYKNWGKFDEAKACYRRAIPLDSALAPHLLLALATTCKYSEYDEDVRVIEEAYRVAEPNSTARRYLAFALGKVFDDLKDFDQAFGYFREGNEIVASSSPAPSMEAVGRSYQRIKDTLGPEFLQRYQDTGIADDAPIFVTGMPRSGTTLVEQILASHPEVHGGGEIEKFVEHVMAISRSLSLGQPFPAGFDTIDPAIFRDKADQYVGKLRELGELAGNGRHITDKSISNYVYIGLIKVMMPNATIILCKRDPRDVGLSIFQKDFGYRFPWCYQLDWIGQFYRYFDDLTDHWNRCLPGQIHTVQYEDLISAPEHHIRALLKHCNLKFDPACLEFHATTRVVTTASRDQVRKPIYKGSVGRWKNYEKNLEPLISALGMDTS